MSLPSPSREISWAAAHGRGRIFKEDGNHDSLPLKQKNTTTNTDDNIRREGGGHGGATGGAVRGEGERGLDIKKMPLV
jgi:hypothetical protein